MRKILPLIVITLLVIGAGQAKGQTGLPRMSTGSTVPPLVVKPRRKTASSPPLLPYVTVTNEFDTNLFHNGTNLRSFGTVLGLGFIYHSPGLHPTLDINYQVAGHDHTGTSRYNRISHYLNIAFTHRLTARWSTRTIGLAAINGPTEIHRIADQYLLEQEFEYRLTQQNRLHFYAAYQHLRYIGDPASAAFSPYVAVEFSQQLSPLRRWGVGYRYERNNSQGFNSRYLRSKYSADYTTPVSSTDTAAVEVDYEPSKYERLVHVGHLHVHRQDQRVFVIGEWTRHLRSNLDVSFNYRYEAQYSNDSKADFISHQIGVTWQYDF